MNYLQLIQLDLERATDKWNNSRQVWSAHVDSLHPIKRWLIDKGWDIDAEELRLRRIKQFYNHQVGQLNSLWMQTNFKVKEQSSYPITLAEIARGVKMVEESRRREWEQKQVGRVAGEIADLYTPLAAIGMAEE